MVNLDLQRMRRRPLAVKAVQLTSDNIDAVARWSHAEAHPTFISLSTMEGSQIALLGHWVVEGPSGDFYAVKPDVFPALYEPVSDNPSITIDLCGSVVHLASRSPVCDQMKGHGGPHTSGFAESWVAWTDSTAEWSEH